jgi:hypothetical protein
MNDQVLSWIVTVIGIGGFFLAGRKIWWCWYVNLICQVFWFMYAWVTNTPAFFVTAFFYTIIFSMNAYKWSKEHFGRSSKGAFKPKPVDIDARYFEGGPEAAGEIVAWLDQFDISAWWKEEAASYVNRHGHFVSAMPETIRILNGEETPLDLSPGEYLIRTAENRIYILQSEVFDLTYERAK